MLDETGRFDADAIAETHPKPFSAVWLVQSGAGGVGRTPVARGLARAMKEIGFEAGFVDAQNGYGESEAWCRQLEIDYGEEDDLAAALAEKRVNRIWVVDVGRALDAGKLGDLIGHSSVVLSPVPNTNFWGAVHAAIHSTWRVGEIRSQQVGVGSTPQHYTVHAMTGQMFIPETETLIDLQIDDEEFPVFDDVIEHVTETELHRAAWDQHHARVLRRHLADVPTKLLSTTVPAALRSHAWKAAGGSYCHTAESTFGRKSYLRLAHELLWLSDARHGPDSVLDLEEIVFQSAWVRREQPAGDEARSA